MRTQYSNPNETIELLEMSIYAINELLQDLIDNGTSDAIIADVSALIAASSSDLSAIRETYGL